MDNLPLQLCDFDGDELIEVLEDQEDNQAKLMRSSAPLEEKFLRKIQRSVQKSSVMKNDFMKANMPNSMEKGDKDLYQTFFHECFKN